MELDPTRMCELLVGLPAVNVLGVEDAGLLRVSVETAAERPRCGDCGGRVWVKDRPVVELVDLPCFGRRTRLVWRKHRWRCPSGSCSVGSWTEDVPAIAAARLAMTDRAGRWATEQTGRCGRTIEDVAADLGADWHTVNDAVVAYGAPLVDDVGRFGTVTALGLDPAPRRGSPSGAERHARPPRGHSWPPLHPAYTPLISEASANRSSAYRKKMSPSTGEAYSDAFSPELARSRSAASQSVFCGSPRSVAMPTLPSRRSIVAAAVGPRQAAAVGPRQDVAQVRRHLGAFGHAAVSILGVDLGVCVALSAN